MQIHHVGYLTKNLKKTLAQMAHHTRCVDERTCILSAPSLTVLYEAGEAIP